MPLWLTVEEGMAFSVGTPCPGAVVIPWCLYCSFLHLLQVGCRNEDSRVPTLLSPSAHP